MPKDIYKCRIREVYKNARMQFLFCHIFREYCIVTGTSSLCVNQLVNGKWVNIIVPYCLTKYNHLKIIRSHQPTALDQYKKTSGILFN